VHALPVVSDRRSGLGFPAEVIYKVIVCHVGRICAKSHKVNIYLK
jgi:hypothetical protein